MNETFQINNTYLHLPRMGEAGWGLYWYDFGARMFDEQLGRWHVPDPMNQYISPYIGMGNRPSSMIDPDGMWAYGGNHRWTIYADMVRGIEECNQRTERILKSLGNNSGLGIDMDAVFFLQELTGDSGLGGGGGQNDEPGIYTINDKGEIFRVGNNPNGQKDVLYSEADYKSGNTGNGFTIDVGALQEKTVEIDVLDASGNLITETLFTYEVNGDQNAMDCVFSK